MPLYYRTRADAHFMLNQHREAIADCDRALEVFAEDPEALTRRAAAYTRLGNPTRALQDLDVALEIDPGLVEALGERAYLRFQRKDFEGCYQDARAMTDVEPDHLWALHRAGLSLIKLHREAEAVPLFEKAIELDERGEKPNAIFWLGCARYQLHDEAAFQDFQRFVDAVGPRPGPEERHCHAWAKKALAAGPEERWTLAATNPILR